MTFDTIIRDSHIVTDFGIVEKNIIIDEGKIVSITNDSPSCDKKINGKGLISIPGPIDTHVHYGVYSPIDEAAKTESHAAAIGGITTIMRMLRLGDSYKKSLPLQLEASKNSHLVDYSIHASIFNNAQVEEMPYIANQGICSFKIYMNLGGEVGHVYMDMNPGSHRLSECNVNVTDDIIENIVKQAAYLNCPILVHAEDYESCACGIKTAKQKHLDGLSAWSESRSPDYEVKAIKKISKFARNYNCVLYFVHIGSEKAIKQILEEKSQGTKIFVETCPHYLTLSHENQHSYLAKVMPPIRTKKDNEFIWKSLQNDLIDTVGTDHVANRLNLKLGGNDVWGALAGFPGVGTALPILLSEGINRSRLSLQQLVKKTSSNAAKIFGMYPKKGNFGKGSDADIVMMDLKMEKKVTPDLFGGYSDYIVYDGMVLRGWPVKTLVRGELVAENFQVIGKYGYGKLVKRN